MAVVVVKQTNSPVRTGQTERRGAQSRLFGTTRPPLGSAGLQQNSDAEAGEKVF